MNADEQGGAFQLAGPGSVPPTAFIDLVDGKFCQTNRAQLAAFFAGLGATDDLVVHFHGGLVSRESALASAKDLSPVYARGEATSLFVIWNTDLLTTLTEGLVDIAAETIFRTILQRVQEIIDWKITGSLTAIPGAMKTVGQPIRLRPVHREKALRLPARSATDVAQSKGLSAAERLEVEQALVQDPVLERELLGIAPARPGAKGAAAKGRPTRMSPAIMKQLGPAVGGRAKAVHIPLFIIRLIIKVAIRVIQRCRRHTDHELWTTIVEEVLRAFYVANAGGAVWKRMKADAMHAFGADPTMYGGSALHDELVGWLKHGKRLTLVGHSAGSVFILELLDHLAAAQLLTKADVVLMAPACTFERFRNSFPALQASARHVRMFSLSDSLEHGYWEVPIIYNASLLYLVSGVLESRSDTPVLGMERFYSGEPPYQGPLFDEVSAFLANQQIWSPADAVPQRECGARRHGGFTQDAGMRESLVDIAREGLV